ncbi:MAG: hypothetical protein O2812_01830, partial [Chloroflexi bacterium]|nr:hypothetical protein [Chloroflexota bacterium]
ARSVEEVPAAEELVDEALGLMREAEMAADLPAAEDPFEGLCRCDPAHGPAVTEAPMRPDGLVRPSCRSCREKADEGSPQMRRMVPGPAGPIPFDS